MAFSSTEQQQIRTYLGYADTNVAANAWLYSTIGQVTTDSENAIRSLLGELTALDTQLATVRAKRLQVSQVDGDTVFLNFRETLALRDEAGRLCNRIGVILGIQVQENVYGSGGGSGAMPLG